MVKILHEATSCFHKVIVQMYKTWKQKCEAKGIMCLKTKMDLHYT